MAYNSLSMRKILDVLRLFVERGRSKREIARVIGASPTTASDYLARTKVAGLRTPYRRKLMSRRVTACCSRPAGHRRCNALSLAWPRAHADMRRKGVTLDLVWQKHKAEQPDRYQCSAFCGHYRNERQRLTLTLAVRQTHMPGEKLFPDFAGQTTWCAIASTSCPGQYPPDIRKVIDTTIAIESSNMSLRQVAKARNSFPTDMAVSKPFYLAFNIYAPITTSDRE